MCKQAEISRRDGNAIQTLHHLIQPCRVLRHRHIFFGFIVIVVFRVDGSATFCRKRDQLPGAYSRRLMIWLKHGLRQKHRDGLKLNYEIEAVEECQKYMIGRLC